MTVGASIATLTGRSVLVAGATAGEAWDTAESTDRSDADVDPADVTDDSEGDLEPEEDVGGRRGTDGSSE